MDLSKISVGPNPPKKIHAIIESPLGGTPVKYEVDKASGVLYVNRFLYTAMFYLGNYGFIPHTLSPAGDPCNVLVIDPAPLLSGAVVACRPIGALSIESEGRTDETILSVPTDDLRPFYSGIRSYLNLPQILRDQVAHFFTCYKELEHNKASTVRGWMDAEESERSVMDGIKRARGGD